MQKHVNLLDLVKSFPTNIFLQNLASIQQRTSLIKFDHLAEKSELGAVSNLSTKVLGDWHTMAKEGTVAFLQKLHELNFPVPDTSPPGNFRQVGQPVHIKPMLQNIENASDVLASFAQSFSETIANRSEAEGAALTHAIQDACDRYLRFVDRALKIAPLGAQLVEAQQWLNRTRMTIPSEVPSMAQAKEAYNDLEAKFDNVSWAANKSFEVFKFKFKFPRARTFELFRARSRIFLISPFKFQHVARKES